MKNIFINEIRRVLVLKLIYLMSKSTVFDWRKRITIKILIKSD